MIKLTLLMVTYFSSFITFPNSSVINKKHMKMYVQMFKIEITLVTSKVSLNFYSTKFSFSIISIFETYLKIISFLEESIVKGVWHDYASLTTSYLHIINKSLPRGMSKILPEIVDAKNGVPVSFLPIFFFCLEQFYTYSKPQITNNWCLV